MQLSAEEFLQKYAKHCGHCNRNTFLPYEYEWTCVSCGFNLIKRKHELSKKQQKKTNFNIRLKYAEEKIFCICVDEYKIHEGNDYDKVYGVLSTLKKISLSKNIKIC